MNNHSFIKFSGIAAILSAVLFIASILGMQFYLASDLDNMDLFIANMNQSQGMMLLYGWPGFVATLLILPLVQAIDVKNISRSQFSKNIHTLTVIGLGFILIGYMFHLALTYYYAPFYEEVAGSRDIAYLIKTIIGVQDMFWLAGDLLSFLGIALLTWIGLKDGYLPRWLVIWGTLAGTMASIGSFGFIPQFKSISALSLTFITGFSLFAIWEIVVGVYFIRQNSSSPIHSSN